MATARRLGPRTSDTCIELAGTSCTAIITNTPHNTEEACAIVRNLVALVEGQHVEFVAVLFRSIWCASRDDWPISTGHPSAGKSYAVGALVDSRDEESPMHAYAWYVWRKTPWSGPSLKVRVGKSETITALSAVNLPMRG